MSNEEVRKLLESYDRKFYGVEWFVGYLNALADVGMIGDDQYSQLYAQLIEEM